MQPLELARIAAKAADDKKGIDPIVLDVSDTVVITDAFVITSGTNPRQVLALAEGIEEAIKAAGEPGPVAVEGMKDASWVLLDFGSFVVHVFLDEVRAFYSLERLWGDAPRIAWDPQPAGHRGADRHEVAIG